MNRSITLFLLGALAVATQAMGAQATLRAADSIRVAGNEYLRRSDWAKANDCELRWVKPEERLQLTNRRAGVLRNVDSREAEINGVAGWLRMPTACPEG